MRGTPLNAVVQAVSDLERSMEAAGQYVAPAVVTEYVARLADLRHSQGNGLPPPSRLEHLATDLRSDLRTALDKGVSGSEPWRSRQIALADALLDRPPLDFLRWPEVRKAGLQSWRVGEALAARAAMASGAEPERWLDVSQDAAIGAAVRLRKYPEHGVNSVFVASHLHAFERETGFRIGDFDTILEFGGGYGAMCRSAHRAGFRGRYVIFDLPVVSALQRYVLRASALPHLSPRVLAAAAEGIATVFELADLKDLIGSASGKTLFIATWSFSEAPLAVRGPFEALLPSISAALICYQSAFSGVDNRLYFHRLAKELGHLDWLERRLRSQPLNYYLFGRANSGVQRLDLCIDTLFERLATAALRWLG